MRRLTAAVSLTLLVLLAVTVAEASLGAMLAIFGSILKLQLGIEFGDQYLQVALGPRLQYWPDVAIWNAGTVGSCAFTAALGLASAAWKFRMWRPSA